MELFMPTFRNSKPKKRYIKVQFWHDHYFLNPNQHARSPKNLTGRHSKTVYSYS